MTKVSNNKRTLTAALLGLSMMAGLIACKKDDKGPVKEVQLRTDATYGSILIDKDGRTLYFFANDAAGTNTCTGGCEALWPVFNAALTAEGLGAGLALSDFATATSASGKAQLVYKGRPLYYYAPLVSGANTPEAAGEIKGEGVGGIWYVAKPDYSVLLSNTQLVGADGKNYLSNFTEGVGKTVYFTDNKGVTLYTFSKDKQNVNSFTKADFSNNTVWPIYETDKVVVPSVLDKTLFASITVFGKKQLTYKGWPLYGFGQDGSVKGATKGVSFPTPGIWPVGRKDIPAATP